MDTENLGISRSGRRLSRNPNAIRHRIHRNSERVTEDLILLHEATYGSYKPVEEWTWEELQHGKPRHPVHGWQGKRPGWITPIVQEEIARRLRTESLAELTRHAGKAVRVLSDFLTDIDNPTLRFKAAQLILEYAAGRPEVNVAIQGNIKLESVLAEALVLDDGSDAHPIIEGAIVELDDDEGDTDG